MFLNQFFQADLSADILKEGQELERAIEKEENDKQATLLNEADNNQEQHDMRFKRLMHLLDRSKFYSNFLLQRMQAKKEEEKVKVILSLLFYIYFLKSKFMFVYLARKARQKGCCKTKRTCQSGIIFKQQ